VVALYEGRDVGGGPSGEHQFQSSSWTQWISPDLNYGDVFDHEETVARFLAVAFSEAVFGRID